ncbi:MAG: hypothetical protein RL681_110 [Candidatus Parcubacteria bacterium]|jgi:glycosyltransferase involved in cell wall biosynthesis
MKIAVVHLKLALESGDPRMALSLAKAYKALGHDVIIYTAKFDKQCFPELNSGLDIRVIDPRADLDSVIGGKSLFSAVYKRIRKAILYGNIVKEIARALPADVDMLHCQNDDSYKLGLHYKKKHPSAKIIWVMHNPPFYHSHKTNIVFNAASTIWAWWEHHVAKKYSKAIDVVVTYDKEKAHDAEELNIPVILMAIPVDFDGFYAPVKSLNDKGKPIMLLSAGGLSRTRRFEDVAAAVAIVRKKGYDARARIICKDYWNDENYRGQFNGFLRDIGMEPYVEVYFDGAGEREFIQLMKNSSIFVFPSNIKIWGMTVFEAMAAGLPVIVSRITSVVEFLRDGENALFVDPESPSNIAEKIEMLLADDSLSMTLAKNGQRYVKDHLSWTRYAQVVIDSKPKIRT